MKNTYRRPLIARLRNSSIITEVLPGVATASLAVIVFLVAPLFLIGNTDRSGPAAGDPDVCISSRTSHQHDSTGPESDASGAGLCFSDEVQ